MNSFGRFHDFGNIFPVLTSAPQPVFTDDFKTAGNHILSGMKSQSVTRVSLRVNNTSILLIDPTKSWMEFLYFFIDKAGGSDCPLELHYSGPFSQSKSQINWWYTLNSFKPLSTREKERNDVCVARRKDSWEKQNKTHGKKKNEERNLQQ